MKIKAVQPIIHPLKTGPERRRRLKALIDKGRGKVDPESLKFKGMMDEEIKKGGGK